MYKVDIESKQLNKLTAISFGDMKLKERYDIQEWIEKTPEILGEDLLVIEKEYPLPSGKRLDLLAIDKQAKLVIIELKRDNSGNNVDWQAIRYASVCANLTQDEIYPLFVGKLKKDGIYAQNTVDKDLNDEGYAQNIIEEFLDVDLDRLNDEQRIMLVAKEFHSDVISSVLWLRDHGVDISCIRLTPYVDQEKQLFISPEIIIPLPEAKDYIIKKETKQKEAKSSSRSTYSLKIGQFDEKVLREKLIESFKRDSELTPRLILFFETLLSMDKKFNRDEIKKTLFAKQGFAESIGKAGSYLSGISQFLTKNSNSHLRQVIEFDSGEHGGATKNNYQIIPDYKKLLTEVLEEVNSNN